MIKIHGKGIYGGCYGCADTAVSALLASLAFAALCALLSRLLLMALKQRKEATDRPQASPSFAAPANEGSDAA